MAKMILTAEYVALNGTDLSTYVEKAEFKATVEDKETTTYGSGGAKERIGGLKDGELSIDFLKDYAAGLEDAILWPLFGTVVTFEVRPTNAAVSTSNPKYTGSVLIKEHVAIGGGVGDVAKAGVSYPTSGVITRATS